MLLSKSVWGEKKARGEGEREREREEKRRETFARSFAREKSDTHRSQKPLTCSPMFSIFFFNSISRMQFITNLQVLIFLEPASFIPMSSYLQYLAEGEGGWEVWGRGTNTTVV